MSVKDYTKDCHVKIKSGITAKINVVCACDVLTFPPLKTTTGTGDSITLDGDIVLKAGKKFASVDIIIDSGKLTHTGVGMKTSKAFQNKLDFKVAKDIASDEWMNQNFGNPCLIAVVTQRDGKKRVYGNIDLPAWIETAEGTLAENLEGETSWICQLMDSIGEVAPYYEGAIDVTE